MSPRHTTSTKSGGEDRLAERFPPTRRDVHAQPVAKKKNQRAREARKAVQTSDDEGALSCAVLLTMTEREYYLLFPLE